VLVDGEVVLKVLVVNIVLEVVGIFVDILLLVVVGIAVELVLLVVFVELLEVVVGEGVVEDDVVVGF
jgi:hypothetical protein